MGKEYLGAAVVASNDLLFIAQLYHHGYYSGLACDVVSVKLRKCYLTSLGNFLRQGFSKTFSRTFLFPVMKAPRIVIFTRSCTMKSAVCA